MTLPLHAARLSILVGLLLALLKLGAGYVAGSLAVFADGWESAGDVVASLILWLGVAIASRPADEDHPYGHGRYEILAAQAIGIFLLLSGLALAYAAYLRLGQAPARPAPWAITPLVVSIVAKVFLARWKRQVARTSGSSALLADSANDWLDVLSGAIALIALALNLANPNDFAQADSLGGALVGLLVILLGLNVIRESSIALLDTMPAPERLEEIRAAALGVPGAWDIEKVHARKTGFGYHVDLHLEVDPASTVEAAHQVSGAVRRRIRAEVPWVADVLIHIEPGKLRPSKHKEDG
ncbi:MAG: cation diffusion facilitator family transporter [Bryobacter sp.]|nr:cation diffusion facilitator family transporter [Bryobacter sp.]